MGLLHTYLLPPPFISHDVGNENGLDFLTDVFGTGAPDCPNDAHHQYEGTPDGGCTIPIGEPHSCSNNLLGQSWQGGHYLSPQQLGRIHRNMHLMHIREYIDDCNQSPTPWLITEDEVWDFDIRMFENIIVRSGATLTITCAVRMPKEGRIIVERGAKLIVDGGLITNACDHERWYGIEVWGNTTTGRTHQQIFNNVPPDLLTQNDYIAANLLTTDPGMVILVNGATIQNGPKGAITTKRKEGGDETYWGGIVYANHVTFDNNKRSVEFMKYAPQNYSRFITCDFIAQPNYDLGTWLGVTMWATNDIHFRRCTFSPNLANRLGEGILAIDAAFTVEDGCRFVKLYSGIDAKATMPLAGDVVIKNNSFDNNDAHIRAVSVDKLHAISNTFGSTSAQSTFGILAQSNTQGEILENTFNYTSYGVASITNPRGQLIIHCNTFYKNYIGIWALGDNRSIIFDANIFENSTKHDAAISSIGTQAGDWRLNHGSLTEPRSNLFSTSLLQHHIATNIFYGTTPTVFFNYFHLDPLQSARLVPICDNDDGCAIANNYRNYNTGLFDENSECSGGALLIAGNNSGTACKTKECLAIVKEYINDLKSNIDGGNKAQLIADLATYPNSQATYQSLYNKSPYLSDSILLQIAQTTAMAAWKRSNLLIYNSPLSDELMASIIDWVPAYTYQILESIRYYDKLSDRVILESKISEEERKKAYILSELLTEMTKQKDYTDLAEIVAGEEPEYALRLLSTAQLHLGNPTQAQAILQQIPIFDDEDQQFYDIQSINIQRALNPHFDLSAEQELRVREIANDQYSTQSGYAQGLLYLYRDEITAIVLPDFETGTIASGKAQFSPYAPRLSEKELNSLLLFPNPASSETICYLPAVGTANMLAIYDAQGNLKATKSITAWQRMEQLPVDNLPNGTYIVSLQYNEQVLTTAKLVIAH